jgi:hypothetical protein
MSDTSRPSRTAAALVALATAAAVVAVAAPPVRAQEHAARKDARWAAVERVFGQEGEEDDGYFRVNLPRTDLSVRIGDDVLSPRFEFTSYVGFVPVGAGRRVLAMGEVILRDDELGAALDEARKQRVQVTAVHNHLVGETPRIVYVHVMARGAADSVASALRAVFARTATPLGRNPADEKPTADWKSVDAILGEHAEAEGPVAEYEFPRHEKLRVGGVAVKSSGAIESGSEVVFQQLGGGRVATTGEIYLRASEVQPVVRTLDEHGLHVTALHTHMLDDGPPRFWVHWYATGDGPTLARGIAAALAHTNGARKSKGE